MCPQKTGTASAASKIGAPAGKSTAAAPAIHAALRTRVAAWKVASKTIGADAHRRIGLGLALRILEDRLRLEPDLAKVAGLAAERDQLWTRLGSAAMSAANELLTAIMHV